MGTSIRYWQEHMALHAEPTVPCPNCYEKFVTRKYLMRHILSKHTPAESKKFFCGQCNKGFNCKRSYSYHENVHKGIKPHKCRYCDMCYQNRSNVRSHERKCHLDLYKRDTLTYERVKPLPRKERRGTERDLIIPMSGHFGGGEC